MGNDPFVDFPAGCWLWGYTDTQPLQCFSTHLVIHCSSSKFKSIFKYVTQVGGRGTSMPPFLPQSSSSKKEEAILMTIKAASEHAASSQSVLAMRRRRKSTD